MGSGTTLGEALKLGANVVGCDINPISSFLVRQELTRVNENRLVEEYKNLQHIVAPQIQKFYKTIDPVTGKELQVLYYFWVKVVNTPSGEEIPLFSRYVFAQNAYASRVPAASILCPHCGNIIRDRYDSDHLVCPKCGHSFNPQKGPAGKTTVVGSDGQEYKIKDLVPKNSPLKEKMYALLALDEHGEKVYLPITERDLELYSEAERLLDKFEHYLPKYEVPSGYNTDQAIGYGYKQWRQFFNKRQLLCLSILLDGILKIEDDAIREQFLCLFSSTLEFNNTFCSYKGEGTGAVRPIFSNHILKPERTPLENSIWGNESSSGCFSTLFYSRLLPAKRYLDAPFELQMSDDGKCTKVVASKKMTPYLANDWDDLSKHNNAALVLNGDSSHLPIPSGSVDYVVTDPPYFDFIHYSELSDFFYAWLSPIMKEYYGFFKNQTSRRENEVQQQDPEEFSRLLGNVFCEAFRVSKPSGKLAFSFHHSRPEGWLSIAKAIKQSRFFLKEVFPVHAELMASTPKASAKEPISIDAMIVCSKEKTTTTFEEITQSAEQDVCALYAAGKKLSKSDLFVIAASNSIKAYINDDFPEEEVLNLIRSVHETLEGIEFIPTQSDEPNLFNNL